MRRGLGVYPKSLLGLSLIHISPVAEGLSVPSIDHLTEQTAEKRNILIEAARIGRGRIREIREIDFEEYGALIIPGGLGLLNNYRNSERCV